MSVIWPELSYEAGRETLSTLRLWTQIVGKIRLARTPWLNHSWHVPLYVTAKGLTTSPIEHGARFFELQFDFNRHVLDIDVSDGTGARVVLQPRSVADFYGTLMAALADLGLPVAINEFPCEIADASAFSRDRAHATYDAEFAQRFWHVLLQADRMLKRFRTGFLGKSSPVHFFWGSFDLAVTRLRGYAVLGAACPFVHGADSGCRAGGNARGVLPRGQQRGILAGWQRRRLCGLLFLRLSDAGRVPGIPGATRSCILQ